VGEVSRYQIRPEIWKAYSAGHHYDYTDHGFALSVAEKYLKRLKAEFAEATGRQATEEDCLIMWKAGFSCYEKRGFRPARMSSAHQDRINRFRNLRTEDVALVRLSAPKAAAPPAAAANPKPVEITPQPLVNLPALPTHDPVLGIEKSPEAIPAMELFTMANTSPATLQGVTPSLR